MFLLFSLGMVAGMFVQQIVDQPALRLCMPEAYYGASQHITNSNCGPTDPRCTVDPCR